MTGQPRDLPTHYETATPSDATRYEATESGQATRYENAGGPDATRYEEASSSSPTARTWIGRLPEPLTAEYEFVNLISNAGAQADIVLMRSHTSGDEVAVKLYRGQPQVNFSLLRSLEKIDPDHVVQILDVASGPDGTWEVQEFCQGGSLFDLLKRRGGGAQPVEWVRKVLVEIATALAAVHATGMTHRDLKPGNVFVRTEEPLDLVLGDFGFARDLAMSVEAMSIVGTFAYAAPEVVTLGETSQAADWWSLGVMIYELLTGSSLFKTETGQRQHDAYQIRSALGRRRYSFDDVTDPRWNLLLRGLLNHSRDHRWGADEVLAWLDGATPEVVEAPDALDVDQTVQPFDHPWGTGFTEPAAAIAALASAPPEEVADYLTGQGATHLRLWLHQTPLRERADSTLNAVFYRELSPGAGLVRLQLLTAPNQPVIFNGHELNGDTLAAMAQRATKRDPAALDWVRSLRIDGVLGSMAAHGRGGERIAQAELTLNRLWRHLDEALTQASKADATMKPWIEQSRDPLEGTVLALALNASGLEKTQREAVQQARQLTVEDPEPLRTWAERVRDKNAKADAEAVLLTTLAPLAIQERQAQHRQRIKEARKNAPRSARHWALRRAIIMAVVTVVLTILTIVGGSPLGAWIGQIWIPPLIALALTVVADVAGGPNPERSDAAFFAVFGAYLVAAATFPGIWTEKFTPPETLWMSGMWVGYGGGYLYGRLINWLTPLHNYRVEGRTWWFRFLPLYAMGTHWLVLFTWIVPPEEIGTPIPAVVTETVEKIFSLTPVYLIPEPIMMALLHGLGLVTYTWLWLGPRLIGGNRVGTFAIDIVLTALAILVLMRFSFYWINGTWLLLLMILALLIAAVGVGYAEGMMGEDSTPAANSNS